MCWRRKQPGQGWFYENGMYQVVFALLALAGASIHIAFFSDRRISRAVIAEAYLIYLLLIYVGLMGLLSAYAHVFRPVQTSATIGGSQVHTNTKLAWLT